MKLRKWEDGMDFNFEWFDKKTGAPIISVARYGLTFNKGAVNKMNKPEYVLLGFDKSSQLIGVKVCDENEEMKTEFSSRERQGYVRINNKQFIKYVASALDDEGKFETKTLQYIGKWYEDSKLMIIDLKKPYNESGDDSEEIEEDQE